MLFLILISLDFSLTSTGCRGFYFIRQKLSSKLDASVCVAFALSRLMAGVSPTDRGTLGFGAASNIDSIKYSEQHRRMQSTIM